MTSRRTPLFLLGTALLLLACQWDLTQTILHPAVEQRAKQSLSGEIPWPGPAAANPDSFRFAVLTDPHFGDPETIDVPAIRAEFQRLGINFLLVVGDLTDNAFAAEFELARASLDSFGLPYYSTIGNHDLYQADGWDLFKDNFGPSCYTVTIGGRLKLILLDTAEGAIGPTQFDWLETELADTTVHKLVATHYASYDGTLPGVYRLSSATERYKLQHLLSEGNAYALVSGHIHGWRHTEIDGVNHFIAGSMAPGKLDYGGRGFLYFTFAHDSLTWTWTPFPAR